MLRYFLVNLFKPLLWILRRNEHDVVDLYNFMTRYVQLSTGTHMLNFGFWQSEKTDDLQKAQQNLSILTGTFGEFQFASKIIDVGSGISAPAVQWKSEYNFIDIIICIDINYQGLNSAREKTDKVISSKNERFGLSLKPYGRKDNNNDRMAIVTLVNATATSLPFPDHFADRVVALESAQHFKPFEQFVNESARVLKNDGLLVVAMPVMTTAPRRRRVNRLINSMIGVRALGILSLTWASEHYELRDIISIISKDFKIKDIHYIGSHVYGPLADYYVLNRRLFKKLVLQQHCSYLQTIIFNIIEKIIYRSALKMKHLSEKCAI